MNKKLAAVFAVVSLAGAFCSPMSMADEQSVATQNGKQWGPPPGCRNNTGTNSSTTGNQPCPPPMERDGGGPRGHGHPPCGEHMGPPPADGQHMGPPPGQKERPDQDQQTNQKNKMKRWPEGMGHHGCKDQQTETKE